MNLTFCGAPPGNLVGSYWYNWPVSQWATEVKVSLKGLGYVQIGAFDVNSRLSAKQVFDGSLETWQLERGLGAGGVRLAADLR